jgi:hypothetical protein
VTRKARLFYFAKSANRRGGRLITYAHKCLKGHYGESVRALWAASRPTLAAKVSRWQGKKP